MAWWMAAIPIGMSMLKGREDQKRWKEQQKIEAVKEKWSPWTGQHGGNSARPSATAPLMQGVASGMALAQNYDDYNERKAMRQKYMDSMDKGVDKNLSLYDSYGPAKFDAGTISSDGVADQDYNSMMRYNRQYPSAGYNNWE